MATPPAAVAAARLGLGGKEGEVLLTGGWVTGPGVGLDEGPEGGEEVAEVGPGEVLRGLGTGIS